MRRTMTAALALGMMLSAGAWAQQGNSGDSSTSGPNGGPPPGGRNSKVDAALAECSAQAGKDSKGRPDMKAMDACMTAKGFTKPSGRPPGPPPQGGRGSDSSSGGTSSDSTTQPEQPQ